MSQHSLLSYLLRTRYGTGPRAGCWACKGEHDKCCTQEDLTIYWKYMYMSGVRVEVEMRDGFMEKVTYEFGHGWTWMGGGGRD